VKKSTGVLPIGRAGGWKDKGGGASPATTAETAECCTDTKLPEGSKDNCGDRNQDGLF